MSSQLTNLTMYKPRKEYNQIERAIYSCSVEFWLSLATITILANLMFKFGVESVIMAVIWAATIGVYGLYANEFCAKTWNGFRRIRLSGKQLQLILLGVGSICAICSVLFLTTPAHALIINNASVNTLVALMSPPSAATATAAAPAAPTAATLISSTGGKIVLLIKVAFLLAFVFIGITSIQKYQERAEWNEIVIPPAVFLAIVGFIDGVVGSIIP
jgi:hypothetical protein